MTKQKKWYKSKTLWGLVVALGAQVAGLFGVQVADTAQAEMTEILAQAVSLGGLAFAAYGRWKAEGELTF